MTRRLVCIALLAASTALTAQQSGGLDPTEILKPLADSWPTYSGDYSGRRYSALTQINQSNVKNLALAWTARLTAGSPGPVVAPAFGLRLPETIVGGVGDNEFVGETRVKGSISAHSRARHDWLDRGRPGDRHAWPRGHRGADADRRLLRDGTESMSIAARRLTCAPRRRA
jgi:hypothetical protein